MPPLYTAAVFSAALGASIQWEAHLDFNDRPQTETEFTFILTDESGNTLTGDLTFADKAQPKVMVSAWMNAMKARDWEGEGDRATGVVVMRRSADAPIRKLEFKSRMGWTPKVTMVPVLRTPPAEKKDEKK